MTTFHTEQERFWAGPFGDEYTQRNQSATLFASNLALFSRMLDRTHKVSSLIEFGANVGLNLRAIGSLIPNIQLSAVEINPVATTQLRMLESIKVYEQSMLDFKLDMVYDLSLVKGVLIHINPDKLSDAYDVLYNSTRKYICIAEYYSPSPVQVTYRGHADKLFKRDFAGEMLERFGDLKLVDYGFVYRRDNHFSQDDINWFLLEK